MKRVNVKFNGTLLAFELFRQCHVANHMFVCSSPVARSAASMKSIRYYFVAATHHRSAMYVLYFLPCHSLAALLGHGPQE